MHRRITLLVLGTCVLAFTALAQDRASERFDYDENDPVVGHWAGLMEVDGELFGSVLVERADDGELSVTLNCIGAGAVGAPCTEIVAENSALSFQISGGRGTLRFEGTISEDGQAYEGETIYLRENEDDLRGKLSLRRTPRATEIEEHYAFTGDLEIGAIKLEMTLVLAQTPGGSWVAQVDIPAQMLRQLPLTKVHADEHGVIHAELSVPMAPATFELTIDATQQSLTGTMKQGPMEMAIDFDREFDYAYRELPRPQHPTEPYPYETRSVVAEHPDGFTLGGTLTIPNPDDFGSGPFPCAILITGSGSQDRDETLLGHKPFLVIADHLTRHGIAVMRYDDRGVGESQVPDIDMAADATSADLATDAVAVLRRLRKEPGIDSDRLGYIGHSEGGIIAPLAWELDQGVAFMVLLAGPGVRGDALLRKQMALGWETLGLDEGMVERLAQGFDRLAPLIIEGTDDDAIREAVDAMIRIQIEAGLQGEESAEAGAEAMEAMLNNEWMRYFLATDPGPYLAALECPVLAMNGTLDLQVWHDQNLDAIERVMTRAGRDITIRRYDGLNHLFQPAETGSPSEYAAIEITFDESALRDMAQWIHRKMYQEQDDG